MCNKRIGRIEERLSSKQRFSRWKNQYLGSHLRRFEEGFGFGLPFFRVLSLIVLPNGDLVSDSRDNTIRIWSGDLI